MKINLDTLKTVAYAISKKNQGYKLLKNPAGTSPYEVNMIKSDFYVDRIYHNESFHNVRLTRKKVGDEFVEDSVDLFAEYMTDPVTKQRSGKKNLFFWFKKDGVKSEAEKWEEPDVWSRPQPKWKKGEQESHLEELFEKDRQRSFFKPRVNAVQKTVSLGGWKELLGLEYDARPEAPSFWSILKHNLNNVEKK
ncbi:hypothetical protein IJI31_07175 [bacterium]|nr:hypothetical protein [bacterium]